MPFGPYSDFQDCVDQNGDKADPEGFCAWLHYVITGAWPGGKRCGMNKSERPEPAELTGPIVFKSGDERQIASAAVLVPGEPDSDGEVLTAEKIEEVAHGWMEHYRNVDIQHSLVNVAVPVESYVLPMALPVILEGKSTTLPKGTWILTSRIPDPEVWAKVKSGALSGHSVMGVSRATLNAIVASGKAGKSETPALKRTLLADLGPDWVANFVSLVDRPAVPKAKWFALKSEDGSEEALDLLARAAKSGRRYSARTRAILRKAYEVLGEIVADVDREEKEKKNKAKPKGAGLELVLDFASLKKMTENEQNPGAGSDAGAAQKQALNADDTQYLLRSAIMAELGPAIETKTEEVQAKLNAVLTDAIKPIADAVAILQTSMATLSDEQKTALAGIKTEVETAAKAAADTAKTEMAGMVIKALEDRFGKRSEGSSGALKGQEGGSDPPGGGGAAAYKENRDSYGRSLPAK